MELRGTETIDFLAYSPRTLRLCSALERIVWITGAAWRFETKSLTAISRFLLANYNRNGLLMQLLLFFVLDLAMYHWLPCLKSGYKFLIWHVEGYSNLGGLPFVYYLPQFYQLFVSFDLHINEAFEPKPINTAHSQTPCSLSTLQTKIAKSIHWLTHSLTPNLPFTVLTYVRKGNFVLNSN